MWLCDGDGRNFLGF